MFKKNIFSVCFIIGHLCVFTLCHAFPTNNTLDPKYDKEIESIIQNLNQKQNIPIGKKLELISTFWLSRPYKIYCLGEGENGQFDQRPLYRTDAFDCETFVDMTLAIAYSNNLKTFNDNIKRIRYQQGIVDFEHRNHFTNIDWNQHNREQNYIKDITRTIQLNHQPIAIENTTTINKKMWYKMMNPERIYLLKEDKQIINKKLQALRKKNETQPITQSKLDYIPLKKLYTPDEKPILGLFHQIPHGAIIQLVTPRSHTSERIGTELDISHLGFAFYKNHQLYFRHASYTHQKVEDVLLTDYLKGLLHHKVIRGIHIEMPQDK
jgi:hypothetical protein